MIPRGFASQRADKRPAAGHLDIDAACTPAKRRICLTSTCSAARGAVRIVVTLRSELGERELLVVHDTAAGRNAPR